jgi:hypothetical protein
MRTARLITGLATASAVAAIVPAAASAATFCVNRPGCTGAQASTVQIAIDAAAANPGRDTILIGSGTFPGEFVDETGNAIDVEGLGASTVLVNSDGVGTASTFTLHERTSTLRDVTVRVTPLAGQPAARAAVSGFGQLEDATVSGPTGVAQLTAVRRVVVNATSIGARNTALLSDSIIRTPGDGQGYLAEVCDPDYTTLNPHVENVTLVAQGTGSGAGITNLGYQSAPQCVYATQTLDVRNTIVSGYAESIHRDSGYINIAYSNYDPDRVFSTGAGTLTADHNGNEDPHFVLGIGGQDYRLRFDSPLIDVGTDRTSDTGDLDVGRRARIVDGHADGTPQVDIGAYEYQNSGPVAAFGVSRTVVDPGEKIVFFSESYDPDDPFLSYTWKFGDGTSVSGTPRAEHAYDHPGTFTAYLVATDDAGHADTAERTITVRPYCHVPHLRGHSLSAARRLLARGHCRLGVVHRHSSTHIRRGRIVNQRPAPEALRRFGSRVNVTLSTGRPRA